MPNFYESTPVPAFNYTLRVELAYDIAVKSIKSFSKNNAYEHIQQGGLNDYVIMKRKPVTEPFTIQIERYVSNALTDPLANGSELTAPMFLTVLKDPASGFSDDATSTGRVFMFTGCVVTGKEYGELNAERSELLTEIVTIAYREMFVIPNPFSSGGVDD